MTTFEIYEVYDIKNKDINMFVNKEGKSLIKFDGYDLIEDNLTKKPKIFSRINKISKTNKKIKRGYEHTSKDEFSTECFNLNFISVYRIKR